MCKYFKSYNTVQSEFWEKNIKVFFIYYDHAYIYMILQWIIFFHSDFAKSVRVNNFDKTSPKSHINSPDETSPKSVISSPDADHNKTKLKEKGHSSIPPLNNDSSLDVDCIPSLNSEQRRLSLDANIEWTTEYGENDENAKVIMP